jgi:ketosteroid isomerase-like protein
MTTDVTRRESTQSEDRALADVTALLDSRLEACRAKDIDRLMSLYSPDCIYYDVVPPLQYTGSAAIRRNFLRWFAEYEGPIGLELSDLHIAVSGDVAFALMLARDSGNRNGEYSGVWLRSTVCCQRIHGTWSITHEHISLPLDWAKSGMVVLDLTP